MRIATYKVFDEVISGTSLIWYSGSDFDRLQGQGDIYAFEASPSNVPNTTGTLKITQQYSFDSQNWVSVPTSSNDINGALANNVAMAGSNGGFFFVPPFVRLAIQLGGVNPSCRLKVFFTARAKSQKA